MIYLGKVDGKYYVLSTASSIISQETGKKLRTRDVMINTLDVRRGSGKNLAGRSQQGLYALLSYDRWESL